jgi:hypothetical protein
MPTIDRTDEEHALASVAREYIRRDSVTTGLLWAAGTQGHPMSFKYPVSARSRRTRIQFSIAALLASFAP